MAAWGFTAAMERLVFGLRISMRAVYRRWESRDEPNSLERRANSARGLTFFRGILRGGVFSPGPPNFFVLGVRFWSHPRNQHPPPRPPCPARTLGAARRLHSPF